MRKILVTGGCGFIGHHFVEHIIKHTDWEIIVLDNLTYASNGFDRLRDVNVYDDKRVKVLSFDFTNRFTDGIKQEIGEVDYIVHMGAETHVDNSITDPEPFVLTNVVGTMRILDFARGLNRLRKLIYFSTDEVFGPASKEEVPNGYKEWDRYNSTNPYSASKAGGEELALAYANTYKLPVIITHTMNVFGERQHPEKFIPLCIRKILDGDTIDIHSNSDKTIPGSRHWIHARNVAHAISYLLEGYYVRIGETIRDKFNIVGEKEVDNLQMALLIGRILGKEVKYILTDFHSSRPGHDLRYALDGEKLKKIGHVFPKGFEESLEQTIKWTLKNEKWLHKGELV